MATADAKALLVFAGGWSTDAGPCFNGAPQNGVLALPFLKQADNVLYELSGNPRKVGGSTLLNSTAITESAVGVEVTGLFDFYTLTNNEVHKRIAVAGTQILKEDLDGTWDQIKSGLESAKHPAFETFNDDLIIATDSNSDLPQTWNGTETATQDLGGSAPNFNFHVSHKNRVWAAGVASKPSRLYYSGSLDHEDWTGSGAGSIDIDPNDGDRILGLFSHKNELFVFKGPNRGSVHRITGSSPTGSDAFARVPFIVGVGGINHTSICRVNDDVLFVSEHGIHSLAVTAAYGDYVEGYLSYPILSYFKDELNHTVLGRTWGVNYRHHGCVVWTFASGAGKNNVYLCYDYRTQPGKWSRLTSYVNPSCLAIMRSNSGPLHLFAGTTTGFVHELDTATRTIAPSTAYTAHVRTPSLSFGSDSQTKTLQRLVATYMPVGTAYSVTVGATMDFAAEQTTTLELSGGDTLA